MPDVGPWSGRPSSERVLHQRDVPARLHDLPRMRDILRSMEEVVGRLASREQPRERTWDSRSGGWAPGTTRLREPGDPDR